MTGFEIVPEPASPIAGETTRLRRHLLRPARDAVVAFSIFAIASMTLASAPSSASPNGYVQMGGVAQPAAVSVVTTSDDSKTLTFVAATRGANPMAVSLQTSRRAAWTILGLGFSLLAALNLAFFRHLRQAYADPRRRPNLG